MVGVEQWAEIRRVYRVEGVSIREIIRRTGVAARFPGRRDRGVRGLFCAWTDGGGGTRRSGVDRGGGDPRPAGGMRIDGRAGGPYEPGLLALREGPTLEAAVRPLSLPPDVLLVDATGRDHPRGAGMALHLGAVLGLPTIGVTHRPLLAGGDWPDDRRGATSPLLLDGERVGAWLRTHAGARPLAIHPVGGPQSRSRSR